MTVESCPKCVEAVWKRAVFGLSILKINRERLAGRLAHLVENQKGLGGTPPKPVKFLEPAWRLELQTC